MAGKKSSTNEKQLKATVKKLRAELQRADAKAERYKKKVDRLQKAADDSKAQASKLTKRLDKATRQTKADAKQTRTGGTTTADEVADRSVGATDEAPAESTSPAATVDESWTVVQLRSEARSRGLTGMSNKSKAQLLDALS